MRLTFAHLYINILERNNLATAKAAMIFIHLFAIMFSTSLTILKITNYFCKGCGNLIGQQIPELITILNTCEYNNEDMWDNENF